MRIVSTLGGLAICAAVALFFTRFWGYLGTPAQVAVVMFAPLAALAGTEYAARRERTLYFAGLMGLVTLACFILNLAVLGRVFNITSTENALAAWGAFAMLLAYRYGLRPLLVVGHFAGRDLPVAEDVEAKVPLYFRDIQGLQDDPYGSLTGLGEC